MGQSQDFVEIIKKIEDKDGKSLKSYLIFD